MNQIEILDRLFALRRELLRITVATASQHVSESSLTQLLASRDQINVVVQDLIASDLRASIAQLAAACTALDTSLAALKSFAGSELDVVKAIAIAHTALDGLTSIVGHLT